MSKEAEIRVCKNKTCQKVLPAGYKHKYCHHRRRGAAQYQSMNLSQPLRQLSECRKCAK